MTVGELIQQLSALNQNQKVVVDGYEDGYDDPRVVTVSIWPEGLIIYDETYADDWGPEHNKGPEIRAVCITRH